MPLLNEVELKSSLLQTACYNDDLWTLSLKFHDGSRWTYQDVPPEIYDEFITAKSQGKFYTANIKGKFGSLKEEDAPAKVEKGTPPTAAEIGFSTDAPNTSLEQAEVENPGSFYLVPDAVPETVNEPVVLPPDSVHAETEPNIAQEMHAEETKALALQKDNSPKIESTIDAGRATAKKGLMCVVKDDATHAQAVALRNELIAAKKSAFDFLDPIRDAVYKAYKVVQQKQTDALSPIEGAITYLGKEILAYEQKKEAAIRLEAEQRQKEAEAAAVLEQKRRSEELTLSAATEAQDRGDAVEAEHILNNPIQAAPVPVFVPRVAPSINMSSKRENWKAEITDFDALICDVAAGIALVREGKGLGVHAPSTFLYGVESDKDGRLSSTALNQSAKALKSQLRYPGTKAYDDPVLLGNRKR